MARKHENLRDGLGAEFGRLPPDTELTQLGHLLADVLAGDARVENGGLLNRVVADHRQKRRRAATPRGAG